MKKTRLGESDAGERVKVHGVVFSFGKTLDYDGDGGEALTTEVKGICCSPDFVETNGIPYLSEARTAGVTE